MGIHLMVGPHMFLEGLLIQWIICGIQKLYNYDYETTYVRIKSIWIIIF